MKAIVLQCMLLFAAAVAGDPHSSAGPNIGADSAQQETHRSQEVQEAAASSSGKRESGNAKAKPAKKVPTEQARSARRDEDKHRDVEGNRRDKKGRKADEQREAEEQKEDRQRDLEDKQRDAEDKRRDEEGRKADAQREAEQQEEDRLRDLEDKARDEADRVRDAEGRARDAEDRARDAEDRARDAEDRNRNAEDRSGHAEDRVGKHQRSTNGHEEAHENSPVGSKPQVDEEKAQIDGTSAASGETQPAPPALVLLAEADAQGWQERLSPQQRDELQRGLSKLHKWAKHEVKTAESDGAKAQEYFQKEYDRKVRGILRHFERLAHASSAKNVSETLKSAVPPSTTSAGLVWSVMLAATDADDWQQQLTQQDRMDLQAELARLHQKSKKEVAIAEQDGPKAQQFFRREYAKKIQKVVAAYKKKAEQARSRDAKADQSNFTAKPEHAGQTHNRQEKTAEEETSTKEHVEEGKRHGEHGDDAEKVSDEEPVELISFVGLPQDGDASRTSQAPLSKRQRDEAARREARKEDEEARKEARRRDERARHEARVRDEEARREARRENKAMRQAQREQQSGRTPAQQTPMEEHAKPAAAQREQGKAKTTEEETSTKESGGAEKETSTKAHGADGKRGGQHNVGAEKASDEEPIELISFVGVSQDDDASKASQTHQSKRQRDEAARRKVRKEDEEARKEARRRDEEARHEARERDEEARREARHEGKATHHAQHQHPAARSPEKVAHKEEHGESSTAPSARGSQESSGSGQAEEAAAHSAVATADHDGAPATDGQQGSSSSAASQSAGPDSDDGAASTLLVVSQGIMQSAALATCVAASIAFGLVVQVVVTALFRSRRRAEVALLSDPAPV